MNRYVSAGSTNPLDSKIGKTRRDGEILVLLDCWLDGGTYVERTVGGSVSNGEYTDTTQANRVAFRHSGQFNYWCKDGAAQATRPGFGMGVLPLWLSYATGINAGKYWQNGSIVP